VLEIRLDCDEDVILLTVEQAGGIACHTGRHHCFYRVLKGGEWVTVEASSLDGAERNRGFQPGNYAAPSPLAGIWFIRGRFQGPTATVAQ
jgi:hypothetical protein